MQSLWAAEDARSSYSRTGRQCGGNGCNMAECASSQFLARKAPVKTPAAKKTVGRTTVSNTRLHLTESVKRRYFCRGKQFLQ